MDLPDNEPTSKFEKTKKGNREGINVLMQI